MYSTEGIVLRRTDAGEHDSLFTIYTKDFGKITAKAQGVKKEGAKLKGHLEPLNLARISFVLGKNGERLTGAQLLNYWFGIRANLSKTAAAFSLAGFMDKNCFDGDKDEKLWEILVAAFNELGAKNFDDFETSKFIKKFESNFLETQGHAGY